MTQRVSNTSHLQRAKDIEEMHIEENMVSPLNEPQVPSISLVLDEIEGLMNGMKEKVVKVAAILRCVQTSRGPFSTFPISPHDVHSIVNYFQNGGATSIFEEAMINCQNAVLHSDMSKGIVKILTLISKTFIHWYRTMEL